MVEQRIRNAKVGSSTLLTGTNRIKHLAPFTRRGFVVFGALTDFLQTAVRGFGRRRPCREPGRNDEHRSAARLDATVAATKKAASGVTMKIRSVGCKKRRLELAFAHAGRSARLWSSVRPAVSASTHRKPDVTITALGPLIRKLHLAVMLFAPLLALVCLSPCVLAQSRSAPNSAGLDWQALGNFSIARTETTIGQFRRFAGQLQN